jgi:hypothetical protein
MLLASPGHAVPSARDDHRPGDNHKHPGDNHKHPGNDEEPDTPPPKPTITPGDNHKHPVTRTSGHTHRGHRR